MNFFKVVVRSPAGELKEKRLPLEAYLQVVAATNIKQRTRKTLEYFHADRLNYAVVGTPNRLEYDQGFFVKNGDGAADLKPIAHLYKTQVYALADALGIPEEIRTARPTTDTYSLEQGQDEFFFALPYDKMDMVLVRAEPWDAGGTRGGGDRPDGGPGRAGVPGHPDQAEDDATAPYETGSDGTRSGD
jgi:NAD+ synthase